MNLDLLAYQILSFRTNHASLPSTNYPLGHFLGREKPEPRVSMRRDDSGALATKYVATAQLVFPLFPAVLNQWYKGRIE